MRTFNLTIATPEKIIYDGLASYCSFITPEGKMGVKAHHEPFMVVLKDRAEFLYRSDDNMEHTLNPVNAIVVFKQNKCSVIMSNNCD